MSLTRKLLKELELDSSAIERIIAAHAETVDALKEEAAAAQSQLCTAQESAAAIQADFDAYRRQLEEEKRITARREALFAALTQAGANPHAMPLLLDAIILPEEAWQENAIVNPAEALYPWRMKYAALFQVKSPLPVTKVRPPVNSGGLLTSADVKRMSAEDINRHWSAVKNALQR